MSIEFMTRKINGGIILPLLLASIVALFVAMFDLLDNLHKYLGLI